MLGFAVPVAVKVAVALGAAAAVFGGVAWVQSLRVTIADQRAAITVITADRDQEKRTAETNRRAALNLARSHALAVDANRRIGATLEAERKRGAERLKEFQRAPASSDPLPPEYGPYLRWVQ